MAEVTVSELAKTVGASVDRLLMQMKEAGLSHGSADAIVSDEEKQTLLAYLKSLHGASSAEPKKITLRRKTVSTLKSGNRKTVNIEVRKKRTYVKRSDEELETQAAAEAEEKARLEQEAAATAVEAPEVEDIEEEAPAEEATVEPTFVRGSGIDDIEEKRQNAIQNRRNAEVEAKAAAEEAAKAKLADEARKAAEAASALESGEAKKAAKPTKAVPASEPVHDKGRRHGKPVDEDEDKLGKKTVKKPIGKGGKKKGRLQLDDGMDDRGRKGRLRSSSVALKVDNKHTFQKPVEKKSIRSRGS
jgi:translation initiation factor IF-2